MSVPAFDIFRAQTEGRLWQACASTLDDAQSRMKELAAATPGDYVIVDQETRNTLFINARAAVKGTNESPGFRGRQSEER